MMSEQKNWSDEVIRLIHEGAFELAEEKLSALTDASRKGDGQEYALACALRGYLHMQRRYRQRDERLAAGLLLKNLDSAWPRPFAYVLFADCCPRREVAMNYLRQGRRRFPDNAGICTAFIRLASDGEARECMEDALRRGMRDGEMLAASAGRLLRTGDWGGAYPFLQILTELEREYEAGHGIRRERQKEEQAEDRQERQERLRYHRLLRLFAEFASIGEEDKEEKWEELKQKFSHLREEDAKNKLRSGPQMGEAGCCLKMGQMEKALACAEEIPVDGSLTDFNDGPQWDILADMYPVYKGIFAGLIAGAKDDEERCLSIRVREALYLYWPSEIFGQWRCAPSHLHALEKYYPRHRENTAVGIALCRMQLHAEHYAAAFDTYLSLKKSGQELCWIEPEAEEFLAGEDTKETEKILKRIREELEAAAERDLPALMQDLYAPVTEYLWEQDGETKYRQIAGLAGAVPAQAWLEASVTETGQLFETAYSLAYVDETSRLAQRLYRKIVENDPSSCASWNNLGVICEKQGDLDEACRCYRRAFEQDGSSELYKRNVQRVSEELKKYEGGLEAVERENGWLIGRLDMLRRTCDALGEFSCSYRDRAALLRVSPQKAEELFEKFLKQHYIFKLPGEGKNKVSRYRMNPLVCRYLAAEADRLEQNRVFEQIGERLNMDAARSIGYTEELTDLLDKIEDKELRDILKRDIFECAVSVLAGQNKSAIVLSGSVMEALLVYRLQKRGVQEYDIGSLLGRYPRVKPVRDMILNELLEVGKKTGLLSAEEYHLSNFIRFYRNIIHPSCEIRRSYEINDQSARLMWNALLLMLRMQAG